MWSVMLIGVKLISTILLLKADMTSWPKQFLFLSGKWTIDKIKTKHIETLLAVAPKSF